MENKGMVRLETKRLILRLPTTSNFEAFHSWGSNPENTRYMAWGPNVAAVNLPAIACSTTQKATASTCVSGSPKQSGAYFSEKI